MLGTEGRSSAPPLPWETDLRAQGGEQRRTPGAWADLKQGSPETLTLGAFRPELRLTQGTGSPRPFMPRWLLLAVFICSSDSFVTRDTTLFSRQLRVTAVSPQSRDMAPAAACPPRVAGCASWVHSGPRPPRPRTPGVRTAPALLDPECG